MDVELSNDILNRIVIESQEELFKFAVSLKNQADKKGSDFTLLKKEKELEFSKIADIIVSPFDLKFEKAVFQKALYKDITENLSVNEKLENRINNLFSEIINILDDININSDFQLSYDECPDVYGWLKKTGVELKKPEGGFLEQFLDYAETVNKLLGKNIFFLVNMEAYLPNEQMQELEKWISYNGLIIVLISNYQKQLLIEVNDYILDVDLCEIH